MISWPSLLLQVMMCRMRKNNAIFTVYTATFVPHVQRDIIKCLNSCIEIPEVAHGLIGGRNSLRDRSVWK